MGGPWLMGLMHNAHGITTGSLTTKYMRNRGLIPCILGTTPIAHYER